METGHRGPNKLTTDLKAMILGALDDAGGREYLHKQATVNPTAFMSLVGKVLPTTLVGDPKRPIVVSVTEEERRRAVDALNDAGGRDYLHKQAVANPTAFMGLVGKVLPTTLVGDPKRPIVVSVTEEERRRAVDAAIDAVFGVYTETKLVDTRAHTVDTDSVYTQDAVHTIEHEAEKASATSELQAVDSAEPNDNIVRLSHTKSHTSE